LLWIIKRKQIQLVICGHIRQGIEALMIQTLLGTPYVVFVYAKELHQFGQSKFKRWLLSRVLKKAAKIITISQYSKQLILDFSNLREDLLPAINILHPIASPALSVPDHELIRLKSVYGLHNRKVLFSISRLEERKGIDMAIKAMPMIWEKVPEAMLVIGSSGPYEKQLRSLAQTVLDQASNQEDVHPKIIFVGRISDIEKAAWFTLCDVFITPSRVIKGDDAEGFGIVFLEANAYAKPVIAGKSGGIPDAVVDGETGLLVTPENVEEIAEACIQLLQNKDMAHELGLAGKRRVEHEFNQKIFCQQLHTIVNSVKTA
jgi:phosphatidylinositol alpha-1,6-mannosyltransferase